MSHEAHKHILAFVGMPGAGKTEAVSFLRDHGVPVVRFGDLTDEELKKADLPITPQNEQSYREKIRNELGMAAYAIKAEEKIKSLLKDENTVAIDGLYSWEEYIYLKERFPQLKVIFIYSEPEIRYNRLSTRPTRPFTKAEARKRDISEIEKLHKGGSIAIADHIIVNNSDDINRLYGDLKNLLKRLDINL